MTAPGPRVMVALGNAQLFGQERENVEVLRAARAAGVDALFVTNERWGHREIEPALERLGLRWARLGYAGHFSHRLPRAQWLPNLGRLATGSRQFLRLMRSYRPTHVQVANPHYFLGILPALALSRTPVVYRIGDAPTVHHALYRQLWQRAILPRTARFVCVSAFIQTQMVALGADPSKTEVVRPLPPTRPAPTGDGGLPADLRDEIEGRAPAFAGRTVVFVGEVGAHKGVHLLVEALGRLLAEGLGVRLLVAGQHKGAPDSPFVRDLLARVAALPVGAEPAPAQAGGEPPVRFLGYVEDVADLLRLADVHAAPSVCEEAAGLVVAEAKQAGVPSVVFPSGGMPEFVRTAGEDGWVCTARTAEALADGLRHYLAMDAAALDACGRAASASLEAIVGTPEQFAAAWRRIYDETARGPYAAAP